jgi:hypothetical protein
MPNQCGPHKGYQRIMTIYMKYPQSSIIYYNKNNLGSATLCGYATAVNTLFELRKYRPPINFNDKNNMAGVIITTSSKKRTQQSSMLSSIIPSCQNTAISLQV